MLCEEDKEVKSAICQAMRKKNHGQSVGNVSASMLDSSSSSGSTITALFTPDRDGTGVKQASLLGKYAKRGVIDKSLNTMEDYNKIIGATEAIVSGSIAMTAA